MKALAAREEQFLTDAKGKRTGVVLDLKTYEHLREAEEELADIHAYDALQERAHSEIAAGRSVTLTSYRANRGRKAK
jgi:PHD/YefM family antitoxin component YafN of YafNO toxin-antitoxin module